MRQGDVVTRLRALVARTMVPGNTGMAFMVGRDLALTCAHCLSTADGEVARVTLVFPLRDPRVEVEADVIRTDPEQDVALLKLRSRLDVDLLNLASSATRDSRWRSVLFPPGADDGITLGATEVVTEPAHKFYEIPAMELFSANASNDLAGVSGGPVLVGAEIVGVITAQLKIWAPQGGVVPAYQRVYALPLGAIRGKWTELRIRPGAANGAAVVPRDIDHLRRKVRDHWVDGMLRVAIGVWTPLAIPRDRRPNAPFPGLLPRRIQASGPVPANLSQLELFEAAGRALLFLGGPGSGKTVGLLELARDLIDLSEVEPLEPVPVVLALSAWNGEPLATWIVSELRSRYQVPEVYGKKWLDDRALVVLFDGLDELAPAERVACVAAVKTFRETHGLVGVAITCRSDEYAEIGAKLQVDAAVELLPLGDDQVQAWLDAVGAPMKGLRAAIDASDGLRELARTPLFLQLMAAAVPEQMAAWEQRAGAELEREIIGTWIDRTYEDRGAQATFGREVAQRQLAWLAGRLVRQGNTFLAIDELQPELLGPISRAAYLLVTRGAMVATVLLATVSASAQAAYLMQEESWKGAANAADMGVRLGVWSSVTFTPSLALGAWLRLKGDPWRRISAAVVAGGIGLLGCAIMMLGDPERRWMLLPAIPVALAVAVISYGEGPSRPWSDISATPAFVPAWPRLGVIAALTLVLAGGMYAAFRADRARDLQVMDGATGEVTRLGLAAGDFQKVGLSMHGARIATIGASGMRVLDLGGALIQERTRSQFSLAPDGECWIVDRDGDLLSGLVAVGDLLPCYSGETNDRYFAFRGEALLWQNGWTSISTVQRRADGVVMVAGRVGTTPALARVGPRPEALTILVGDEPESGCAGSGSAVVSAGGETGLVASVDSDRRYQVAFPLLLGMVATLFVGVRRGVPKARAYPMALVYGSLSNSMGMSLAISIVATIIVVIADPSRREELMLPVLIAVGVGGVTAMWFGGYTVIKHVTLRLLMWLTGTTALNFVRLLEEAVNRGILRRVGGAYFFLHLRVLQHYASLDRPRRSDT
jgi:hypothetical protein